MLLPLLLVLAWAQPWQHLCASAQGEELRVGLLATDNWPFSGAAKGEAPSNHAGLEGFEVGATVCVQGC